MKLQKLNIRNLASIEAATIDFEHSALADESLFLICGETGAGKSTLLDAICLALYNDTPRMEQAANETYQDESMTFAGKKPSNISDVRQLMRRNTAEAWVELDFIGSNDIPYTARWYVARARLKTSGTVQKVTWSLLNRHSGTEYIKKEDIKAEIQTCIGLNFEQFCRTTILAQGEFTRFLQSSESEKSDILEKLTGTEIYSRIGRQIFATRRDKKAAYDLQCAQTAHIRLLTEEETEAMQRNQTAKEEANRIRTAEKERIGMRMQWLRQEASLEASAGQQEKALQQLRERTESAQYRQTEELIRQWYATTDARQYLNDRKRLTQQYIEWQADIRTLQQTFSALCREEAALKHDYEGKEQERSALIGFLRQEEEYAGMYAESQLITASLQAAIDMKQRAARLSQQAEDIEKRLPEQEKLSDRQVQELLQKQQANEQKQREIDSQQKELNKLQAGELQKRSAALNEARQGIADATMALKQLARQRTAWEAARQEEARTNERREDCLRKIPGLEANCKQAHQQYTDATTLYEKQKESVENWAKEARARLTQGDQCPVCGQRIEHLPGDEHFASLLTPIVEHREQQRIRYEQAQQELNRASAELKSETALLARNRKEVQTEEKAYESLLKEAGEKCMQAHTAYTNDEETAQLLAAKETTIRQEQQLIEEKLAEVQAYTLRLTALVAEKAKLQQDEDRTRKKYEQARMATEDLKHRLHTLQTVARTEEGNSQKTRSQVAGKVTGALWIKSFQETPQTFIERLTKAANHYQQQQQRVQTLTGELEIAHQQLDTIGGIRQRACRCFPGWTAEETPAPSIAPHLVDRWNQWGNEVQSLHQALEDNDAAQRRATKQLDDILSAHPELNLERLEQLSAYGNDTIEEYRDALQKLREECVRQESNYKLICSQLDAHRAQKPAMEEGDTLETLQARLSVLDEAIAADNQLIGQIKSQLASNRQQAQQLRQEKEKSDALYAEFLRWDRLSHYFGDDKGTVFRNIAQSFVLKELLQKANNYLHRLSDRYELECQSGSLTILLRDFYQGGCARPVSTLSGGESFLVSLSLALGLSSLSQHSLTVDTLFIDEGFGTLSDTYLNAVMDTLEKLHRLGGRKVGIISHVEGLKERIRTQIQVRRIDHSRSEVIITNQ